MSLDELACNGVTSISDAGGYWGQNLPAAFERARREGTLTVRAANSLYLYPDLDLDTQLAEFARRFSNDDPMLRFDTAKVYLDGILDLGTAWLLDPYVDPLDPDRPNGFQYFTDEQLDAYIPALHELGYRINFHVIGDAAVRRALDGIEFLDDDPDRGADRRHRTTHTFLVHPDDLPRFADVGVIADFQHNPDAIDVDYHEFLSTFVGPTVFDLIPTDSVASTGATVTISTDWDAGPLSPFESITRTMTRETHAISDLDAVLASMTIDTAYALGHDDLTGSLEVGKAADYIIIDQQLFEIEPREIANTTVILTVVDGRQIPCRQ